MTLNLLEKIILGIELCVVAFCILSILLELKNVIGNNAPSPFIKLQKRLKNNEFEESKAYLINRKPEVADKEKRDIFRDHVDYTTYSGRILPEVDFGSYEKGYKYEHRETAPRSKYQYTVNEETFYKISLHDTDDVINVYYATAKPEESYLHKEVQKAMMWNDKKEKIYREILRHDAKQSIFIFVIPIALICCHLVYWLCFS